MRNGALTCGPYTSTTAVDQESRGTWESSHTDRLTSSSATPTTMLVPEALRRIVDFPDAHEVDLLAPKLVDVGGRCVTATLLESTLVDAPLRIITGSLEDGMMPSLCSQVSDRNSILADYDHYFIRTQNVGSHGSGRTEPEGHT